MDRIHRDVIVLLLLGVVVMLGIYKMNADASLGG